MSAEQSLTETELLLLLDCLNLYADGDSRDARTRELELKAIRRKLEYRIEVLR